ncbi:MAG: pyridoxal phosphate-dependent aminotransferase [Bacteroidales bacterium]|nr:pyridoxal phosphate-dependent aminotransferase [Bacteroidales bacterium]
MPYDFDAVPRRRGSGSYKWDAELPEGVVLSPEQRERVIPLWVADMDFPAAPFILEALRRRCDHGVFGYTKVQDSYYEAVIRWFGRRHSLRLERDWIQYTSGVVPALSAVIKALAAPGEGVILQTPVYNCFFSSVRNNGCRLVDVPLLRRGSGTGRFTYAFDFEGLEKACAEPSNRLLLLCNPHNPAGRVWTAEELAQVGEIARRHDVIVVTDEIHCEIVRPGLKFVPFAAVNEANLHGSVTLCSPSKSFNIAGLQIANILSDRPEWRERIDRAININEVCDINPFGPVALEAAYTAEGERWLEALNERVSAHFDLLSERFRRDFPSLPVCELEGTYLAWIDVSSMGLSSTRLEAELLRGEQVWVNAGSMYGSEGFIRINLACPTALLCEGLDRVAAGLKRRMQSL